MPPKRHRRDLFDELFVQNDVHIALRPDIHHRTTGQMHVVDMSPSEQVTDDVERAAKVVRGGRAETSETVCGNDLVELKCCRVVGPLESNVDVANEQNRIGRNQCCCM